MKKTIKGVLIIGGMHVIMFTALLLLPRVLDVQKYKPMIEKRSSEILGRPMTIGGKLSLSLFPWVGATFSDIRIENPAGFAEKNLAAIKALEIKIKVLPLVFGKLHIARLTLQEPRVALEQNKNGMWNWRDLAKPPKITSTTPSSHQKKMPGQDIIEKVSIQNAMISELIVSDGSARWADQISGGQGQFTDLTIKIQDITMDEPIGLLLSARRDGQPISLRGTVGPMGREPGKDDIPLDLFLDAGEQPVA
ncbi:MAG: AsmA family protein, partial [Deltaproteobacteria bacterium]|nr:AsmA family protein [Deltaproteobacteria bacterium]